MTCKDKGTCPWSLSFHNSSPRGPSFPLVALVTSTSPHWHLLKGPHSHLNNNHLKPGPKGLLPGLCTLEPAAYQISKCRMSSLVRNDFGSLLTEQTKTPDVEVRDKLPPSLPGQAPGPQMHHWVSGKHSCVRHTEVSGDNQAPERQTPPLALTYPGGLLVCPQLAWTPWVSTTGTINFTASLSTPRSRFDAVINSGPMGGLVIECKEARWQLQGLGGKQKYRGIHMGPGQSSGDSRGKGTGVPAVASSQTHRNSELEVPAASV